jgi:hypothetical protein
MNETGGMVVPSAVVDPNVIFALGELLECLRLPSPHVVERSQGIDDQDGEDDDHEVEESPFSCSPLNRVVDSRTDIVDVDFSETMLGPEAVTCDRLHFSAPVV